MALAEQRFRAMGSDCHVLVVTPDLEGVDSAAIATDIVALAAGRVELLEQSWSRFRPTSELNHLNASAGSGPVRVSPDLLLLVDRMQQAWAQSEGRFDPTVLSSMLALAMTPTSPLSRRGPPRSRRCRARRHRVCRPCGSTTQTAP